MELHSLRPAIGAVKNAKKRLGRGQGSGKGGTATKGHKGDKARSGHKDKRHFEGGQTPLQRRTPKRGFKNFTRVEYTPLNLSQIQLLVSKTGLSVITINELVANGYCKKTDNVKVLGQGKLTSKVNITANAISESAKASIEAAGGSVQIV